MFLIVMCLCLQTLTDLPQSLKEVLLGAHEQIKEHGVLPELPSRPCVNDILNLYVEQKRALQHDNDVHEEVGAFNGSQFSSFSPGLLPSRYACSMLLYDALQPMLYIEDHLESNSSLALHKSNSCM